MSGLANISGTAQSAQLNAEVQSSLQFYRTMSLLMPILALVGGGIAFKNGRLGGALMAVSALGILWAFGFGISAIVSAVLLGVGAFLAFQDAQKPAL